MVKFGLAIKKLLNQGLPEVTGAAESQMLRQKLNACCSPQIRVLVNFDQSKEWMDLLESIDRSYPVDEQLDDDLIEKQHNVSINFARTSNNNNGNSGQASRGGNNNRGGNGSFNGECFRCHQFGHRMFECPNRQSNGPNQGQNQSFNQGNRGYSNQNRSFNNSNSGNGYWRRNEQPAQGASGSNWSFTEQRGGSNRGGSNAQVNNIASTQNFVNSTMADNSYDDDNCDNQSNYSLPSTIHSNSVRVSDSKKSGGAGNTESEFPFYSNSQLSIHNKTTETIVMSKDVTNENRELGGSLLVTTVFANVFNDKPREMRCLIDGGSAHSFISPLAVADKYLKRIKTHDKDFTFKDFKIIGAT
jgi:hypothetical protein